MKPYRAYDVLTGELIGYYDAMYKAYDDNPDRGITVIYRPSKKKSKPKEFPYV